MRSSLRAVLVALSAAAGRALTGPTAGRRDLRLALTLRDRCAQTATATLIAGR